MEKSFRMHELQPIIDKIRPTMLEMGIEPNKGAFEIKDIVHMADVVGLALSPSQAIEAIYYAKGDVEKFKSPFTDVEFKLFLKWFTDHKSILRLKTQNYMTKHRGQHNSITVRPSISVRKTTFHDPIQSPRNIVMYGGSNPLTPNSKNRPSSKTPYEDIHFRSKLQVSIHF